MVRFLLKSLQTFRSSIATFLEENGIIDTTPVADGEWDDLKTWVETDQVQRVSVTRFGGGLGVETINVEVPLELKRNDEIIPVARRNNGVFNIGEGSSIKVMEF